MKTLLYSTAIVCFFLVSCKKIDELTQFNLTFDNEAIIPASTGVNLPFNVVMPEQETNAEQAFEVNDTRKDKIEEIFLRELKLSVNKPNGEDFSFLQQIELYLNADGLDEVKIAWKEDIPETATTVFLDLTEQDLQEYIKKDEFSLRVRAVTDEVLANDHTIGIDSEYWVNAKVIGK